MAMPPQLIRVKRKATEEAPVSFLRVQETKRHRSDAFVYQRQEERPQFAENIPSESHKPIIHTSGSRTRNPAFQSPTTPDIILNDGTGDNGLDNESANISPTRPTTSSDAIASEPRRFHMSRKDIMLGGSSNSSRSSAGISKKRSATALFVERKIKKISARPLQKYHQAITNGVAPTSGSAPTASERMEVDKQEPRKFKKPGLAKYAKKKEETQKYQADLPKSMTNRWDADMDKLAAEMNAYAMEQIGLNLQQAEAEKKQQTPSKAQPKYKPKPTKRYAERHPEAAQASTDVDMMDTDAYISDSDDSDYIIETYERVPASKMEHAPPQSVGVLVFDDEPDLEFFYGDGGDSEDEWAEDEDDENAENYYAADYPDEEVASDDEFGQNPYSFRTRNASDLEEYDLDNDDDDAAFSDKAEGSKFITYIGRPRDNFTTDRL
ncbi:uncharacterized protein F4822DRAFT_415667 [Hypoxylon trugodes]|uniref:uncharacterized protein n=1 Tax=Hypoxylon trugodes TaxID=326681 RepID=UPI0021A248A3|nr:uncharacterized protein F4822DRAFT_415667 [Hypoxylon trugodes]KAI1384595.1 hypothetical protein F4822DRAFT_415667 [Hypoxylon trugodes]